MRRAASWPSDRLECLASETLPLFPLRAVLFPGGRLQLRLFEPRYIDLVRRCGRDGSRFGICLIEHGEEAGEPAIPATVGTEVAIVDFAMTAEGLLGITVEGRRRFRVDHASAQSDGLVLGQVRWLPEPAPTRLAPEFGLLALLLERILERAGAPDDGQRQQQLQQADWVAWRLAEWLPLEDRERQQLLAADDVDERLQRLLQRLPDFQAD